VFSPRVLELLDAGRNSEAAEQLRDDNAIELEDAKTILGPVAMRRAAWRRQNTARRAAAPAPVSDGVDDGRPGDEPPEGPERDHPEAP
jgi:hypothetical protein